MCKRGIRSESIRPIALSMMIVNLTQSFRVGQPELGRTHENLTYRYQNVVVTPAGRVPFLIMYLARRGAVASLPSNNSSVPLAAGSMSMSTTLSVIRWPY